MKIAFLNLLASPEQLATGLRTAVLEVARKLGERGHETTVLTSGTPGTGRDRGVSLVQLGRVAPFSRGADLLGPRYLAARIRYMLRASRWVRAAHLDLVEVAEGGLEQLFLLPQRPCPIVTRLHGNVRHTLERSLPSRAFEKMEAMATRASDAIYSPSAGYADMIARDYGIRRSAVRVIPYCFDVAGLGPGDTDLARERWGIGSRRIVLFTGSLSERKGLPILRDMALALRDRDDIVLAIVGGKGLDDPIAELPNVVATGELRREELGQWYKAASVFVMPSRFENLSLSILEALAFGLPVIALDVGGNAELVQDDVNGYLVEPSSAATIPSLVCRVIDDAALQRRFAEGSLAVSGRYDAETVTVEIEAFLRGVIDGRHRQPGL